MIGTSPTPIPLPPDIKCSSIMTRISYHLCSLRMASLPRLKGAARLFSEASRALTAAARLAPAPLQLSRTKGNRWNLDGRKAWPTHTGRKARTPVFALLGVGEHPRHRQKSPAAILSIIRAAAPVVYTLISRSGFSAWPVCGRSPPKQASAADYTFNVRQRMKSNRIPACAF